MELLQKRDNLWLEGKLYALWERYFSDVKKANKVHIFFGKHARRRLASIRQKSKKDKNSDTEIKVTAFYKDPAVPEYVVEATLAHELCHYAHGFASPHPQFSKYPHRGDIVDAELRKRGLGEKLKLQEAWLKTSWGKIIGQNQPRKRRKRRTYLGASPLARLIRAFGL